MIKHSPRWTIILSLAFLICPLLLFIDSTRASSCTQEKTSPRPHLGLEILLADRLGSPLKIKVFDGGSGTTVIPRQRLTIYDPALAGDFTAVGVWADDNTDGIKVRLTIIYNDLSNQEWWRARKEKPVGSFPIREGESIRPAELAQFGIQPFEMRVIDARPIVVEPGTGPPIINKTKALEVVRLEKSLDQYRFWLKNNSEKNVVAFYLSTGGTSVGADSRYDYGSPKPVLAAGATTVAEASNPRAEQQGISISLVVFEDGSFEGDPLLAAQFVARTEGTRIEAAQILQLIEQTLSADDGELATACEELEVQLSATPDAIDKQSSLELLKARYPSFDENAINILYSHLMGAVYDSRNSALDKLGDVKRQIRVAEQREKNSRPVASRTSLLRDTLMRIKSDFEKIVERQKPRQ